MEKKDILGNSILALVLVIIVVAAATGISVGWHVGQAWSDCSVSSQELLEVLREE